MKSKLATGTTLHHRFGPSEHKFSYPVTYYLLDLEELDDLAKKLPWFSINKFNLLSIRESDYGNWDAGTVKAKILSRVRKEYADYQPGQILLLTMPRFLGYIFNPVSFYVLKNRQGELEFLVLEINNTYYERCQYVLAISQAKELHGKLSWQFPKNFHVSPFFDLDHMYHVTAKIDDGSIKIEINLKKEKKVSFNSNIDLRVQDLEESSGFWSLCQRGLRMAMTYPLILFQALKLYSLKRLAPFAKPNPSTSVIRATPVAWADRLFMTMVFRCFKMIKGGRLELRLPDGRVEFFGSPEYQPVVLELKNYNLFKKIALRGNVGFGESYSDGDWESPQLAALISLFLDNHKSFSGDDFKLSFAWKVFNYIGHLLRRNSLLGSRKNISAHYDLSNNFFKLFLDESMVYSSGIYSHSNSSLEDAQNLKLNTISDKARIEEGMKVLEIGSGWGALAERMAARFNCDVTSITLSTEQKKYAEEHAEKMGLNSKIKYLLEDYRNVEGKFDRIVSVEMLEAVGRENIRSYFKACNKLLNESGVLVVQVIAYPDSHYQSYCRQSDWVQKHIFPGSHLPSLSYLSAMASKESFVIESVDNYAKDYAYTLKEWLRRFDKHEMDVRRLGFDDEFIRKWRFYLAACEAEFDTRWLSVYQIVFTRANNKSLDNIQIEKLQKGKGALGHN